MNIIHLFMCAQCSTVVASEKTPEFDCPTFNCPCRDWVQLTSHALS